MINIRNSCRQKQQQQQHSTRILTSRCKSAGHACRSLSLLVSSTPFLILYSLTLLLLCFDNVSALIQSTTNPPILDVPTYSLATLNEDGTTNMNILTYATPVSISPTRVWSMGLFKDTLSEENLRRTGICVLQLLTDQHVNTIPLLGGTSGRDVDKRIECEKLGFAWEELEEKNYDSDGFRVLPGCASYMKMTVNGGVVDAGSHFIVPFCEVIGMYTSQSNNHDDTMQHLSTATLRNLGIITEKGRVAEEQQYPQQPLLSS